MKLLLDTHIWLWGHLEPNRLKPAVAAALQDTANQLYLSPVSVWETLLLISKGRINVSGDGASWVRKVLTSGAVVQIPLSNEIVIAAQQLPLEHGDPADRWIAATAAAGGLTLVTADRKLISAKVVDVLAN